MSTKTEIIPAGKQQEGSLLRRLDGRVHMIHMRITSQELADTLRTALSPEELAEVLLLAWGTDKVDEFSNKLRYMCIDKRRQLGRSKT